jgi:hypothetical protein
MANPAVSFAIDIGPASQRRETSRSRVSLPSAAKTDAEPATSAVDLELRGLDKMFLDQRHDHRPATLVRRERLRPACQRDSLEA